MGEKERERHLHLPFFALLLATKSFIFSFHSGSFFPFFPHTLTPGILLRELTFQHGL